MIDRIMRVIKLDFPVFKEIESDSKATTEAAIIVVITTLLSAFGSAVGSGRFFSAFISEVFSGIVGWVAWAVVAYFVAKSLFSGKGTLEGMLRVLGYANAPRLLGILGIIPCVGWIGTLAGGILALIMGFMAIREGMDLDAGQAIIVIVVGAIAWIVVSIVFGLIFGTLAGLTRAIQGR